MAIEPHVDDAHDRLVYEYHEKAVFRYRRALARVLTDMVVGVQAGGVEAEIGAGSLERGHRPQTVRPPDADQASGWRSPRS
jgi:hypothetical protein